MAPTLPQLSFGRMRSYIYRLPLFTRLIVSLIIILWIISISLGSVWDIQQLCSLIPDEMNMGTRKFRASLDLIKSN
jgi:glycosylphosphatidylinositol transamidase